MPKRGADTIKHKYVGETREEKLTGEMTVNSSAVFVL